MPFFSSKFVFYVSRFNMQQNVFLSILQSIANEENYLSRRFFRN